MAKMEAPEADILPNDFSSRRSFLKISGAAGFALVGGLNAEDALSGSETVLPSFSKPCAFSQLPAGFVYLNSGTEGSMPDCVISAFRHGLKQWASDPTTSYETDAAFGKRQEMNRASVGRFLGVGPNNICLTDNTTMGLSMTLMGLNFRPDDRVIITNHEHTAIRSPLGVLRARLGLRVITRPFPPAGTVGRMNATELLDALFPDTADLRGSKALCVSHVYSTSGVRLPLHALREKANELDIRYLIVDGAQAMGMIDLTADGDHVEHCDFYACPGHKWLNGPPGTGVLYIRNEDIRPPEFYPVMSQRMEKYTGCDAQPRSCFPIAEALQVRGCSNTPGFSAMVRAMKFAQDAGGPAKIEQYLLRLSRQVREIVLSRAPHCVVSPHSDVALSSGLTTFFPFKWDNPRKIFTDRGTADFVVSELLKIGVQVRSIGFQDLKFANRVSGDSYAIRVSTGFFNTPEQVARFGGALENVLNRIGRIEGQS